MKVITSTLADSLADVYGDFETEFGFGPCGAYAALKRTEWGMDVAVCSATDGKVEFPHYVLVDGDAIIDLANPLDAELTYSEIEILNRDEMPELVDAEVIDWLRAHHV